MSLKKNLAEAALSKPHPGVGTVLGWESEVPDTSWVTSWRILCRPSLALILKKSMLNHGVTNSQGFFLESSR